MVDPAISHQTEAPTAMGGRACKAGSEGAGRPCRGFPSSDDGGECPREQGVDAVDCRDLPTLSMASLLSAGRVGSPARPLGVCALIAPWNFPTNLGQQTGAGTAAGCAVVIKPASPTPLSIPVIIDAVAAAGVPAGVVNLVTGSGRLGMCW